MKTIFPFVSLFFAPKKQKDKNMATRWPLVLLLLLIPVYCAGGELVETEAEEWRRCQRGFDAAMNVAATVSSVAAHRSRAQQLHAALPTAQELCTSPAQVLQHVSRPKARVVERETLNSSILVIILNCRLCAGLVWRWMML